LYYQVDRDAASSPLPSYGTVLRLRLDAYGWEHDLTDEQILERLLALNLERAAAQCAQPASVV
jgi:hypothetical protein